MDGASVNGRLGSAFLALAALTPALVACGTRSPTPAEMLVISDAGVIFTVHTDGTNKTVLPAAGGSPSWTPDGRIIFVSPPPSQIWVMAADGSNARQIGDLQLAQGNPIVKPQMARNGIVAFADMQGTPSQTEDNPGPQNGTWVMQKDGSKLTLVVQHCTAPSLALSGTWLTCTMETNRHREIWRINTDGTGLRQLTFPTDPDYPDANASSISPDERTVAFFSGKESDLGLGGFSQSVVTWGHRNVAVIAAEGGQRRLVTGCAPVTSLEVQALSPGECLAADNPAWSPDGKRIIYDRGSPRREDSGTWVIRLNGEDNRRLWPDTRGAGNVPMK